MDKYLFITLIFFLSSYSKAIEYKCPETIETTQNLSPRKDDGWQGMDAILNKRKGLESIKVYDGHPNEGAELVPDNPESLKESHWTNQTEEGFWIACTYTKTTLMMIREIPKSTKKCTLKYLSQKNDLTTKNIDKLICI